MIGLFLLGEVQLDDIDCAAERVENFKEVALHAVLSRLSGPPSTGICKSCYDVIEPERLYANPRARHCSFCAAEEEARSHHHRRCGPR